jgi:hypothetical protein
MKLNEIIELNGKEYTVELNRESILRIEQYTNLKNASEKINSSALKDKSEKDISENEDPFAETISEDKLEQSAKEKEDAIKKVMSRAFWIWLYPQEKLSISQVEEILSPYFDDDDKAKELTDMYLELTDKSVDIRKKYLEERKNLEALAK